MQRSPPDERSPQWLGDFAKSEVKWEAPIKASGAGGVTRIPQWHLPRRVRRSQRWPTSRFNPDALGKPLGQYSHLTRVKASEFVFIAGQVGVDRDGKVVGSDDFDAQCVQTFANIEAALKSVGAGWGNIVQFTTYLVHSQDIPKFMKFRLREFPKMFSNGAYPPNTLLMIDRLVQEALLVEVQAVAAL